MITLQRDGDENQINDPLTVAVTVIGGTAKPWHHFIPVFSVTFPAGQQTVDFELDVIDNDYDEGESGSIIYRIRPGPGYLIDTQQPNSVTVEIRYDQRDSTPPPEPTLPNEPADLALPPIDMEATIADIRKRQPHAYTMLMTPEIERTIVAGPWGPALSTDIAIIIPLIYFVPSNKSDVLAPSGVRYATGTLHLSSTDIGDTCETCQVDVGMILHTMTGVMSKFHSGLIGPSAAFRQLPQILRLDANRIAVTIGDTSRIYDKNGSGIYVGRHGDRSTIIEDEINHQWIVTGPDGTVLIFASDDSQVPELQHGQFLSEISPGGVVTETRYDDSRINWIQTEFPDGRVERYEFDIIKNGELEGLLERVTLRQNGTVVQSARYGYYLNDNHNGPDGYLRTVELYNADDQLIDQRYYRYYTDGSPDIAVGYVGGLKFMVGAESFRRLVADGHDPLVASDEVLAQYADNHLTYDAYRRVASHKIQGYGCSVCTAGFGGYTYSYLESQNYSGYNSWHMRTTETLPGGQQNLVYTNAYGQVMLFVERISDQEERITYFEYDNFGRLIRTACRQPLSITTIMPPIWWMEDPICIIFPA